MESVPAAINYLDEHQNQVASVPLLIFIELEMPDLNIFDFLRHFNDYPLTIKQRCKIVVLISSETANCLEEVKADVNVSRMILKPLHQDALFPVS